MSETRMTRFECEACGNVQILSYRKFPAGWRRISYQPGPLHLVCNTCIARRLQKIIDIIEGSEQYE